MTPLICTVIEMLPISRHKQLEFSIFILKCSNLLTLFKASEENTYLSAAFTTAKGPFSSRSKTHYFDIVSMLILHLKTNIGRFDY